MRPAPAVVALMILGLAPVATAMAVPDTPGPAVPAAILGTGDMDAAAVAAAGAAVQRALARLDAWQAAHPAAAQEPIALAAEAAAGMSFIDLYPLGDLDGDGRAEALAVDQRYDIAGESWTSQARALRGPSLTEAAWTKDGDGAAFSGGLGDLDGDGIAEIVTFEGGFGEGRFESVAPPTPAPVFAYTSGFEFSFPADVLSGRDAQVVASLEDRFDDEGTSVVVGGLVADAGVDQGTGSSVMWQVTRGPAILVQSITVQSASAGADTLVLGAGAGVTDIDGAATLQQLDGSVLARFEVTGPDREPMGAFAQRAGDAMRIVALWRDGMAAARFDAPLPLEPTRVHTTSMGTAQAWDQTEAPGLVLDVEGIALPDLDGDGIDEVEVLLFELDPAATGLVRATTIIRNGADGAVLARQAGGLADLTAYLPFGDLEGDGKPELLFVRFGDEEAQELAFGVAKADLQPIWSASTTGEPFNTPPGALDLLESGLADWTGDGAPDVALGEWDDEAATGAIRMLDGRTGRVVWQRALTNEDDLRLLGESSGTGQGDLAVLSVTGVKEMEDGPDDASQAVAVVEALAGEDGRVLRRQVLRDPVLLPAGSAGVILDARGVGDIDGDGLDEFTVSVLDLVRRTVEEDGETDEITEPHGSAYVFSVRAPAPVLSLAPQDTAEATRAAAPALPPAEGLDEQLQSGAKDAPVPWTAALAALALAAGAMRRRRP